MKISPATTADLDEAVNCLARAFARDPITGFLLRQELPPLPNPELSCLTAILSSQAMSATMPADLHEQLDEMWFAAAGSALTKNESTLAVVQMGDLQGDGGYLESLRKRGYEILAPGI